MTKFHVTIEVERPVPATKPEANEVARILTRYLRQFTYSAKVVGVKIVKEKKSNG